jgi:hypothetical protein
VRGEWVESVFMERASERGLAVSKPWGDSKSFDFVVGRPGRFVGVQVKSTAFACGGGYSCAVKHNNQAYARGSFDFVAAYVIPEDAWYIVPAEKMRNKETMILCSESKQALYEEYREAWHLLREASACEEGTETCAEAEEVGAGEQGAGKSTGNFPTGARERMEAAGNYFKNYFERKARGTKQ